MFLDKKLHPCLFVLFFQLRFPPAPRPTIAWAPSPRACAAGQTRRDARRGGGSEGATRWGCCGIWCQGQGQGESAFTWVLISCSLHSYSLNVHSVCFETSPYPSSIPPQATYPRLLPLLSKVRHDIINVGLVPGSSVLCPCRSFIRCIVALMPRVSLHFHPSCDDSPLCDCL